MKNLHEELTKNDCALQEILITHWHPDHTEGVKHIFKSITKGKVNLKKLRIIILNDFVVGPIRVSKHNLIGDPEWDTATSYKYITDNHVIETEGATLQY